MSGVLRIQQVPDKSTRDSPGPVSGGPLLCRSLSAPHPGWACVQPPPAATGCQESQLLGRSCQLPTSAPAGAPSCPARRLHLCSPREGQRGKLRLCRARWTRRQGTGVLPSGLT